METALSILIGVGLSAASGFRVFVPFLFMSIAGLTGNLELSSGFDWMATLPAMLAFATATVIEIAAYYIPWLDNLLDTIATPTAVVAGTIATASIVTDVSPLFKWTLAVIAGGGAAGAVQAGTVALRATSTATTGGIANPLVATGEWLGSVVMTILALVVPVLAVMLFLLGFFFLARLVNRVAQRRQNVERLPD
jgi:hypothetical protein